MIGPTEIIVILMFVLLIFFLALPLILRRRYPYRLWVGIVLCLLIGTGQLYLPGGLKYVIGLGILYVILKPLFVNAILALFVANLFSAGIMYWRFLKLEQSPLKKELEK